MNLRMQEQTTAEFEQAVLNSERKRAEVLLALIGAFAVLAAFRFIADRDHVALVPALVALTAATGYGLWYIRRLGIAIQTRSRMSPPVTALSVVFEALVPTLLTLALTRNSMLGPYGALVSPTVATYFLFTMLSILRLNPRLSVLSGCCGSLGYLGVVAFTYLRYPERNSLSPVFHPSFHVVLAALILLAGIAAAYISSRIRSYVAAAVREGDLRRQIAETEKELEIAKVIQQGLLPRTQLALPGYEVAGWNLPADQTGGDYFDWQPLSGGGAVLTLADVSGHGIAPALVMATCRAYARACFAGTTEVSSVLHQINRALVEDLPAERYVTFVAAAIDPARDVGTIISAGHGPILFCHGADGRIVRIGTHGLPLGMFTVARYDEAEEMAFSAGDLLVFLTDGFHEWESTTGEQFGLERVEEVIRGNRTLPPDELIAKLYDAVVAFGGIQNDDLTALIVKKATDTVH